MALDIVAQNIIIDETTGLQDDDVNPLVPPHDTNTTLQYLLTLDDPSGGLTPPEVAFQADFVKVTASAGETITSIILAQDSTGTPFSPTDGVNSNIRTVDGNYVWLFADPTHANVVIGVIGTSDPAAEPAETGPLAFSFALISTSATNADLYTVQYVPLFHPDTTNSDDQIDLTDLVFAAAEGTATTTVNFSGQNAAPGIHEFYLINSPDDASKQLLVTALVRASQTDPTSALVNGDANVSSQGFGVENQSIEPDTDGKNQPLGRETLQVDFVTGGDLNAGDGSQIQYDNHLDDVTQAGFTISQLTPSAPNGRVDIKISAFDVTGDEQGSDFFNGSPTEPAPITSLTLTGASAFASPIISDGTYLTASGNITVSGLGTNVVTITGLDNVTTVDVTTSSQMDRLRVEAVDANEGLDISEFHFTQQITSTNVINEEVGSFINFDDDGPSISTTGTEPTLTVDETVLGTDDTQSFAANFSSAFGADGAGTLTFALSVVAGPSGLVDTLTNEAVNLSVNNGVVEGRTATTNALVFTVSVDATGTVTLDQIRAVVHPDANNPDDSTTLSADNLVQLTATITDKEGDHQSATLNIGQNLVFTDDAPTITVPPEALTLDNTQATPTGTAAFGYDIGNDLRTYPGATAFTSDFVDSDGDSLNGIQLALTGTVGDPQNFIKNTDVTLASEDAASAVFDFTFQYDADPNVAGDQLATATGTLTFDKDPVSGTYTVALDAPIEGFSIEVLQTSQLLDKNPTGNTGHPLIVVEKLAADDPSTSVDEDFFVQFTADNTPLSFSPTGDQANTGDTTFNGAAHDMAGGAETWVSATQSTNGVAGDTIQKGELLTLRFFGEDILSDATPPTTEKTDPTATVDGLVVKFDGIGTSGPNSEDLIVILDLKDDMGTATTADDVEITRALIVDNGDLFTNSTGVPSPYDTQFSLDNNDGLLIIESNDYNFGDEHFEIQGVQIMQSANDLTGSGINLSGLTGATGGSDPAITQSFSSGHTNDVLKITDIGFVRAETFPQDADLQFAFNIIDGDGDTTAQQILGVHVESDQII
jgi:hypothetical protein